MEGAPWSQLEMNELRAMVEAEWNNRMIAQALHRSIAAIQTRKYKLNIGKRTTRRTAP